MDTDPLRMAVEAVVWLRSRRLPEFPTANSSLSHLLRSVHRVKPDSLDDLAALIIDDVVSLEVIGSGPRSIPVAVGLGVAYALFHVYAEVDRLHENLSKQRWVKRDEAKEKVRRDLEKELEKDPSRFHSAAKAGEYYSGWLARRGYSFEPDTVEEWIRGFGIPLKKPVKRLK